MIVGPQEESCSVVFVEERNVLHGTIKTIAPPSPSPPSQAHSR